MARNDRSEPSDKALSNGTPFNGELAKGAVIKVGGGRGFVMELTRHIPHRGASGPSALHKDTHCADSRTLSATSAACHSMGLPVRKNIPIAQPAEQHRSIH